MHYLPERVSELLRWSLLCGLAFFLADAACASLESHWISVPPALALEGPLSPQSDEVPEVNAKLVSLLSTSFVSSVTSPEPSNEPPRQEASPERTVPLTLVGALAASDGGGVAIVSVSSAEPLAVNLGERVADWLLVEVLPQAIVLERDGKRERLEYNDEKSLPTALDDAKPGDSKSSDGATLEKGAPSMPTAATSTVAALTSKRELIGLLDSGMSEIMRQGSLKPVVRDGNVIGMEITVRVPEFPLARLGLQTGDVVVSLNDAPVKGPQDTAKLLSTLRNSSSLHFEIERAGKPMSHRVSLED